MTRSFPNIHVRMTRAYVTVFLDITRVLRIYQDKGHAVLQNTWASDTYFCDTKENMTPSYTTALLGMYYICLRLLL